MVPEPSERRLAAIMFTDIAGYTALMGRDEAAGRRVRERHEAVVRPLVARYHGEWVEERGDESLSIFPSALDAVNCALAIQHALRDDPDLKLRIGVHSGDVTFERGRVVGDGVNVASRIRALAEPGGTCITAEVWQTIRNQPNVQATPLRTRKLKNVDRPMAVHTVTGTAVEPASLPKLARVRARQAHLGHWAAAAVGVVVIAVLALGWWWTRLAEPASIRSLAVLPLENLSGDPEQEYFADGMTDTLIAELGKLSALRVISRQSVMRYKGTDKPMPQIARELGVDAVIEGSVLRSGGRVRITAQLIGAVPERHLWANNYDRDLSDILILSSEVAGAIAGEIQVALTPEEEARLTSTRPVNPEAHEAYLKGRYYWHQFTREGWNRALDYHKEAIAKDPGFAPAYVGLAEAYNLLGSWHGDRPPREAYRLARAAAQKALEIDDTLAEAHTELGFAQFVYAWDWAGAEREFRRGIELDPNSAATRNEYAVFLHAMGRFEEAKTEMSRTLELNPLSPIANADLSLSYLYSGQYGKAREQASKAAELDPDFPPAYSLLGLTFWREGMSERAIDALRKAAQLSNDHPDYIGDLGYVYAVAGRTEEARKLLRKLKQVQSAGHVSVAIAKVHAGLGEKDLAFASLEKAIEEGNPSVVWLNLFPEFDPLNPLRSDPRFADLLRRMNYPGS